MKYCSRCGKEIDDSVMVCPACGTYQGHLDEPNAGLNVLAFLVPIVGLILYIMYHEKSPVKANAIGKWALISFVGSIIIYGIMYGSILGSIL